MRAVMYDMKAAAKEIKFNGGRNKLFKLLKEHKYFNPDNTPIKPLITSGLFVIERKVSRTHCGLPRQYQKALATSEGLTWLQNFAANLNETQ